MVIAILGIALLLLGYYFSIHILWVLGIVAIIVGLIVVVLGHFGYGGPWVRRLERKEAWTEPRLPPWVKINPESPPGSHGDGLEPGDISMVTAAEEFLEDDEEDGA